MKKNFGTLTLWLISFAFASIASNSPVLGMVDARQKPNPVPLINQPLVPDTIAPGSGDFTLTINGTGFARRSVVKWNGSERETTFVSNSQLSALIRASDIATSRTAAITVVNGGTGGFSSNVVYFPVTHATDSVNHRAPKPHPSLPETLMRMAKWISLCLIKQAIR